MKNCVTLFLFTFFKDTIMFKNVWNFLQFTVYIFSSLLSSQKLFKGFVSLRVTWL